MTHPATRAQFAAATTFARINDNLQGPSSPRLPDPASEAEQERRAELRQTFEHDIDALAAAIWGEPWATWDDFSHLTGDPYGDEIAEAHHVLHIAGHNLVVAQREFAERPTRAAFERLREIEVAYEVLREAAR